MWYVEKQNLGAIDRSCARMPVQKSKRRTIEKIKIKIKKKKRRSVHKGVRIIFVLQFKISLTLRSFWGWFTKAMKRHVATTLDRFVGQSLLEFTQRTDVLLPTEHQRRITLVSRFFESAVNNYLNTIQIIVNLEIYLYPLTDKGFKKKYLQIFRNILVEEIYQKIDRKIIKIK